MSARPLAAPGPRVEQAASFFGRHAVACRPDRAVQRRIHADRLGKAPRTTDILAVSGPPMHIRDIFQRQRTTFSFEFFPPRSAEGAGALFTHIAELERLRPTFVSVTYGAGGTTRELTHELVVRLRDETSLDPIPHLTCVQHDEADIEQILERYSSHGISNILALRGDPPKDPTGYDHGSDRFSKAAELVAFIRKFGESGRHPDPRGFGIGVAGFPEGHPSRPNRMLVMAYL